MSTPRARSRHAILPAMEWADSWTPSAQADFSHPFQRGVDHGEVPRLFSDCVSPKSRPASPPALGSDKPRAKFDGSAVAKWIETAQLDNDFSLDGGEHCAPQLNELMDWDEESSADESTESRRRNSLGLALDLRDLKQSLVLSCIKPFDPALLSSQSRPYPSPVSPATTLFRRRASTASPATSSSAASEVESYFDLHRSRQLSTATSAYTSNYDGDDEDCKDDSLDSRGRDLPPSPDLVPISLPSSSGPVPDLPVAETVAPLSAPPAPSHPLHRAHRLSMTPVATLGNLDLPPISEISPSSTSSPEPPRVRKSSIVDLPPVSAISSPLPAFATGASELGLEPLPPTPPRSPGARLRMMSMGPTSSASTDSLETVRSARSASATTRPWVPSEAIPQLFKRQRRL